MQRSSTLEDLMERRRKMEGAKEYDGHSYFDLMRFDENVRHMIIFDVLTHDARVGDKGKRTRMYLSEVGYERALADQAAGNIKIVSHAVVDKGYLYYDHRNTAR